MSDDIKPRLRVPANAKKGELVEVKTLITHPMENGQRKDADGKLVPRLIVSSLAVTYNDKPVLNATLMSHTSAMFMTIVFVYCYWRLTRNGRRRFLQRLPSTLQFAISHIECYETFLRSSRRSRKDLFLRSYTIFCDHRDSTWPR